MRHHLLLSIGLFVATASAEDSPVKVWPMPATLPSLPPGATVTTYPMPRVDWIQRVQGNIAKAHKAPESIKLVFDGDSITDGWQGGGKEIWKERYAKYGAFDFGISGDRTEHLLWRLSQGQVDGLKPKLVAIMIGTNNTGNNSVEEIAEGIKTIVAEYRKRVPDAVILLQAVFPRGKKADDPQFAKIKSVNEIIAKLHDGEKVIYVDFGAKFLGADGSVNLSVMPDALHPNTEGYKIWADAIQSYIDKYLQ